MFAWSSLDAVLRIRRSIRRVWLLQCVATRLSYLCKATNKRPLEGVKNGLPSTLTSHHGLAWPGPNRLTVPLTNHRANYKALLRSLACAWPQLFVEPNATVDVSWVKSDLVSASESFCPGFIVIMSDAVGSRAAIIRSTVWTKFVSDTALKTCLILDLSFTETVP